MGKWGNKKMSFGLSTKWTINEKCSGNGMIVSYSRFTEWTKYRIIIDVARHTFAFFIKREQYTSIIIEN